METTDTDFVTGVSIAESSLEYPRTLVHEAQVNGKTELPITCSDANDCVLKCEFFSFHARDGGLPVRNHLETNLPLYTWQIAQNLSHTVSGGVCLVRAALP